MYLLRRHPLRGGKSGIWIPKRTKFYPWEKKKAMFIEHPENNSNHVKSDHLRKWDAFWEILKRFRTPLQVHIFQNCSEKHSLTVCMILSDVPMANEWEAALLKTVDLIQPCQNSGCTEKWYVFDNSSNPKCPFCGTPHQGTLPVLDLYFKFDDEVWKPENHRLMVYHNQYLFKWHVSGK